MTRGIHILKTCECFNDHRAAGVCFGSSMMRRLALLACVLIAAGSRTLPAAAEARPSVSPSPSPSPSPSLSPISPQQQQRERQALVSLYQTTGGNTTWLVTDGWLNDSATRSQHAGHCSWFGVLCKPNGALIILSIWSNGLIGTIPDQMWILTQLEVLQLYNNL